MNKQFLVIVLLLTSPFAFSQSTFYIQNGTTITKVEKGDPSQLSIVEWRVRLYKRGVPTSGTSYWGIIKGSSASKVMETLKKQQQFELDFNKFIGKGSIEDEVYTHFNPIGPIAITDVPKASELPLTDAQNKVADLYEKTTDLFYTGLDVKNSLDVIIKGEENPYADIGSNFMQYSENIKDNILQLRVLQNLLLNHITTSLQNINNRINEITKKVNVTQTKLNKVAAALNNVKQVQNKNTSAKSFYIFLTTSIEIKPKASQFSNLQSSKTTYIISKPLLHTGNLTDDMQIEKRLFITDLEKHFANEPDVVRELQNKEIEIHYGKPYSKEVSRTSAEGYSAIEAYKASMKETLEGLAQFDFLQL